MNAFRINGNIYYLDFMIHILNNLPEEYNVIYEDWGRWANNIINEKLNYRYEP